MFSPAPPRGSQKQRILAFAKQIRRLLPQYYGCRPLRDGTEALCEGLTHAKALRVLCLEDSDIGSDGAALDAVCQCLRNNATTLQHLNLRDCRLEVDGLAAVLTALMRQDNNTTNDNTKTTKLQHLDLGGNGELGEGGGIVLRDFLMTPHAAALTTLILDANELGDDGVTAIVEGVAHSNSNNILHTLNLETNEIEREGAMALVQNRIASLHTLILLDNMDLPANAARQLQAMYANVEVEDDLNDDPDWSDAGELEAAVDELGEALALTQI